VKHLRQYIRQILSEVDLGNKVWADRADAPAVDHHWGDEPDTEIEAELWSALHKYMGNATPFKDKRLLAAIKDAAKDPRYQDIFITRDSPYWDDQGLMRGQSLPKDHVEQLLKIKLPSSYYEAVKMSTEMDDWEPFTYGWFEKKLEKPYLYKPEDFFRQNTEVSSWTPDYTVAEGFAMGVSSSTSKKGDVPIIFHAVRGSGDFLDLRNIYFYENMADYIDELEYLALDDVLVNSISIFYEDDHRGDW